MAVIAFCIIRLIKYIIRLKIHVFTQWEDAILSASSSSDNKYVYSGGSRISHRKAPTSYGGPQLPRRLCFKKFVCQNERIWTLRGRAPVAPPGSANGLVTTGVYIFTWIDVRASNKDTRRNSYYSK